MITELTNLRPVVRTCPECGRRWRAHSWEGRRVDVVCHHCEDVAKEEAMGDRVTKCRVEGCGVNVQWGETEGGKRILLEADPVEWEPGVFYRADTKIRRAQAKSPGPFYRCHWGRCHE